MYKLSDKQLLKLDLQISFQNDSHLSVLYICRKEPRRKQTRKHPSISLISFSSTLNALSLINNCIYVGHMSFMIISLGISEHKYPAQVINQWNLRVGLKWVKQSMIVSLAYFRNRLLPNNINERFSQFLSRPAFLLSSFLFITFFLLLLL